MQQGGNAPYDFKSDESSQHKNEKCVDQVRTTVHLSSVLVNRQVFQPDPYRQSPPTRRAPRVRPWSLCQRRQLEELPPPGVRYLSVTRQQSVANNLVFKIQIQLLIFDQVSQEVGDVAGEHHAGMIRHAGGQ